MSINVFVRKLLLYVPVKMIPAMAGIFLIMFLFSKLPAGQYISYSVSLFVTVVTAQLCAGWVGSSYIYYYTAEDKRIFFSSCIAIILLIAPAASVLAASVSMYFSAGDNVFVSVWLLCCSQILFFFLSSACQAGFFVKQQMIAVFLQALIQIALIIGAFYFFSIDFQFALLSLAIGYLVAAMFMLVSLLRIFGVANIFSNIIIFVENLKRIFAYGAPLSPWILGMLVMVGADRFAIGYYDIELGDSYLSLKDLFVGAAGLLSMPLLMMVHPFVINRFRDGAFAINMIEISSGFLIVVFTLLWGGLYFAGFEIFEHITGKRIEVSRLAVFLGFLGVFFNSASIYFQKRLEVHRKMKLLAYFSLMSAALSLGLAWVGARYWGVTGAALGVLLAQMLYFFLVTSSLSKRLDLYRSFWSPSLAAGAAMFAGFLLYESIEIGADFLVQWEKSVLWLIGFSAVSALALWKGVKWGEFLKVTV